MVQTDDLREVLDVMLTVPHSLPQKAMGNMYTEEDVVQRAQQMANEWIALQRQQMAQQQVPEQRSRPQSGQAQQADVSAQQGVPRSFLDITPDKMTREIWATLNPVQQQEYAKRYT